MTDARGAFVIMDCAKKKHELEVLGPESNCVVVSLRKVSPSDKEQVFRIEAAKMRGRIGNSDCSYEFVATRESSPTVSTGSGVRPKSLAVEPVEKKLAKPTPAIPSPVSRASPRASGLTLEERLKRLKRLLDQGLVTPKEAAEKRKEIEKNTREK